MGVLAGYRQTQSTLERRALGEAYYLCTVYLLGIRLALLPPRHLSEYSLWDKEIAGPPHHREMIPLSVC